MFPLMNGFKTEDALSPFLFTFALQHAIIRVQFKQVGLKFNDKHQLLVYADDENILAGSIHNIMDKAEVLLEASVETETEVNAEKF